jgi:O-antigen ligase
MLLPTAVFLVVGHDLLISTYENYGLGPATMAQDVLTGTLLRKLAFAALGIFGLVLLARWRRTSAPLSGGLGLAAVFLVAWCLVSLAWSVDSVLSGRRIPVLAAICIAAWALGRHAPFQGLVRWIFVSTSVYLWLGIMAELYLGTFALASPGYRFAGTLHPNSQGVNCALLVLSGVALDAATPGTRALQIVGVSAALPLLVLTKSRTAILCFVLALLAYSWLRGARRSRNLLVGAPLLVAALACLVLLVDAFHPFLLPSLQFGREQPGNETLGGRISLWGYLLGYITERPLLGSGYGAFWTAAQIVDASNDMGWIVAQAHSAYLEVGLHLGMVGLLACFLVVLLGFHRAALLTRRSEDKFFPFAAAVLVFCALHGLVESEVYSTSFLTFVFMTLSVRLSVTGVSEGAPQPASPSATGDGALGGARVVQG